MREQLLEWLVAALIAFGVVAIAAAAFIAWAVLTTEPRCPHPYVDAPLPIECRR